MSPSTQARILIVDDVPQNVALIQAQLERAGYAVTIATSGQAGIDAATSSLPDVILLDIMMPGLDGYEVCRILKAQEATRAIPIIMLTALSERADKIRALDAGADDFLTKPVDRAELLARVRSSLRLKQLYDDLEQSRRTIEHERAMLAAIMASMSDGLLVLDRRSRIQYCNRRAGELLHVDPAKVTGTPFDKLLDQISPWLADLTSARDAWQAAQSRAAERPHWEIVMIGPRRDLQIQFFPVVDASNVSQGIGIILRDVTTERALQRAKDEMISTVSHELRTPLASLVGFAELLLMRDFSDHERREILNIMVQEGHRLTALTNDFLDLQRLESGRSQINPVPTALTPLLEHAVVSAGDDPARPITLEVPNTLPPVQADADRILQVLANLLSNARKYSPKGGAIRVTARCCEDGVEVAVQDQGLGIPPEALPHVFEKFYRVDEAEWRAVGGAGLGLAICRSIVEAHGGRIWATSAGRGQGSTFTFTLPLAGSEETKPLDQSAIDQWQPIDLPGIW